VYPTLVALDKRLLGGRNPSSRIAFDRTCSNVVSLVLMDNPSSKISSVVGSPLPSKQLRCKLIRVLGVSELLVSSSFLSSSSRKEADHQYWLFNISSVQPTVLTLDFSTVGIALVGGDGVGVSRQTLRRSPLISIQNSPLVEVVLFDSTCLFWPLS